MLLQDVLLRIDTIINDIGHKPLEQIKLDLKSVKNDSKQSLVIILASMKMLLSLVHDLLDFAQINSGKFKKEQANFDIKSSVKEVMLIQQ